MVDVSNPQWSIGADGARISFLVPSPADARQICDSFKPGKQYTMEVKQKKKKRSLDANALMWALIGEMTAILKRNDPGITPDDVYRGYIIHSANYVVAEVWEDDYPEMVNKWSANGIGWVAQKLDVIDSKGWMYKYRVRLFYGSSQYDSAQMAQLIDAILQDAAAIGIDTASESFRALCEQYPGGQYG